MKTKIAIALFFLSLSAATMSLAQKKADKPSRKAADSLFAASNWRETLKVIEALRKGKNDPDIQLNYMAGTSLFNTREYGRALQEWEKYLSSTPKPDSTLSVVLYPGLAKIYSSRNDVENGMKYLTLAVDKTGYSRLDEMDYDPDYNALRALPKFSEVRSKMEDLAYPCRLNPKARQFDFWIGEWDVYGTGTGTLAGVNSIQLSSGGCALLENWTQTGPPHNGKSLNYFDPITGTWEQLWIGSEGGRNVVQRFIKGVYNEKDKVMEFEFSRVSRSGVPLKGRFRFFNQGPNQVRQLNEVSTDQGKTWSVGYDFTYVRRKHP